jgi:fatty acid desaturase
VPNIVIIIAIGIVVTVILSVIFKGSKKVDKGFKINYYKLSYRRKMIRTLAGLPVLILAMVFIYFITDWSMTANILFGMFFFLFFLAQVFYNYFMWKRAEK